MVSKNNESQEDLFEKDIEGKIQLKEHAFTTNQYSSELWREISHCRISEIRDDLPQALKCEGAMSVNFIDFIRLKLLKSNPDPTPIMERPKWILPSVGEWILPEKGGPWPYGVADTGPFKLCFAFWKFYFSRMKRIGCINMLLNITLGVLPPLEAYYFSELVEAIVKLNSTANPHELSEVLKYIGIITGIFIFQEFLEYMYKRYCAFSVTRQELKRILMQKALLIRPQSFLLQQCDIVSLTGEITERIIEKLLGGLFEIVRLLSTTIFNHSFLFYSLIVRGRAYRDLTLYILAFCVARFIILGIVFHIFTDIQLKLSELKTLWSSRAAHVIDHYTHTLQTRKKPDAIQNKKIKNMVDSSLICARFRIYQSGVYMKTFECILQVSCFLISMGCISFTAWWKDHNEMDTSEFVLLYILLRDAGAIVRQSFHSFVGILDSYPCLQQIALFLNSNPDGDILFSPIYRDKDLKKGHQDDSLTQNSIAVTMQDIELKRKKTKKKLELEVLKHTSHQNHVNSRENNTKITVSSTG